MAEEDEEAIEHTIKVSKGIKVVLDIPKVMDALAFKAMTSKASRIFNIAEIPISTLSVREPTKERRTHQKFHKYTEEQKTYLVKNFDAGIKGTVLGRKFNERYGLNLQEKTVNSTVYNMRSTKPEMYKKYLGDVDKTAEEDAHGKKSTGTDERDNGLGTENPDNQEHSV